MVISRIALAIPVCAGLFLAGCGGSDQSREIAYRDVHIAELETQVSDLNGELAGARSRLADMENQPAPAADPSDSARDALKGSGADVEWRNGELVITLTNEILFASGSATLTGGAKKSLSQVAGLIRDQYGGNFVRVEGHTDNQPIRRTKNKWEDNWHLAGARSRAVLHYLADQGGIGREQLSFAGYADTQPRDSNGTKTGRSQNRRVGIVVLPQR
ncbi:MAG: flagellar motor protein MotB [Planctomycetota bacterium]|jgi:chemotaxis protein MotB|nr:flagellar motor protein MotB [Planctomycetota bacterium]